MQARELVEIAALIATSGPALVARIERLPANGMQQYWSASKCRLERWSRALKRFAMRAKETAGAGRVAQWRATRPVVEEILLGEVLARLWVAVAASHDRLRGVGEAEPIARSVLVGQSEARNRALNLMVYGQGFKLEEAVELNRLRRRTERWSDMLLGYFAADEDRDALAFEVERAAEFATSLRPARDRSPEETAGRVILTSLRSALDKGPLCPSPNVDLNSQIAAGVMACLPTEVFDSTQLLQSLWLLRLETKTADTENLLAELLACDGRARYVGSDGF